MAGTGSQKPPKQLGLRHLWVMYGLLGEWVIGAAAAGCLHSGRSGRCWFLLLLMLMIVLVLMLTLTLVPLPVMHRF